MEGSTLRTVNPNIRSWNKAASSGIWSGDESRRALMTVAPYQTDTKGTREDQSVFYWEICGVKPMNNKTVQTILWEPDQFIVPLKQGNACGGKGLAVVQCNAGIHPPYLEMGKGFLATSGPLFY